MYSLDGTQHSVAESGTPLSPRRYKRTDVSFFLQGGGPGERWSEGAIGSSPPHRADAIKFLRQPHTSPANGTTSAPDSTLRLSIGSTIKQFADHRGQNRSYKRAR